MLPRVDLTNKLSSFLKEPPRIQVDTLRLQEDPPRIQGDRPPPPGSVYDVVYAKLQQPQIPNGRMPYPTEHHSRFYSQLYDRMRMMQQQQYKAAAAVVGSAAANAAANAAPDELRRRRRHTSSDSHLSGEMIRRLREQQRIRGHVPRPGHASHSGLVSHMGHVTYPVPPPILAHRDVPKTDLQEANLMGESIPCFSIGGEMRLCLPQILRQVLGHFGWQQICKACEELHIHCAPCTAEQLLALKATGHLPVAAHQCGLITKSDAERLASFLLSDICSADTSSPIAEESEGLRVEHECFGRAVGWFVQQAYTATNAKCIKCNECSDYLDPREFVRHIHSEFRENRTCHWGFDPAHWRSYLHLQEEAYENAEELRKAKEQLEEVKQRFCQIKLNKRKQSGGQASLPGLDNSESFEETKRIRLDRYSPCLFSDSTRLPLAVDSASTSDGGHPSEDEDAFRPVNPHKVLRGTAFRPWSPSSDRSESAEEKKTGNDPDSDILVDEIRSSLSEPAVANREAALDVLDRLALRLQSAESARNVAMAELKTLRTKFSDLESELTKKRDELRELLSLRSQEVPPKPWSGTNEDVKAESPLNLSGGPVGDRESSTPCTDSGLSKDSDDLRDRMISMEAEIRNLKEEIEPPDNEGNNNESE